LLELRFTTIHLADETVVEVTGELDVLCADELFDTIRRAHEVHGHDVTVDLAGVSFMDSRGLATLVRAQRQLATTRASLRLQNPRVGVAKALEVTGVTAYLEQVQQPDGAAG
jgi:anti-anti-sigma factor